MYTGNIVSKALPLDPPPRRVPPMESISSMKMIEGACSLAITNNSRTWEGGREGEREREREGEREGWKEGGGGREEREVQT